MSLRVWISSLLLLGSVGHSFGDDETWVVQGRIVDQQARPVADVDIATVWNANGVTLKQLRNFSKDGKVHPEFNLNEGALEPWGDAPGKTDGDGHFSIELRSLREYKLMAVDKERQRGCLIIVDSRTPRSRVEGKLVPLVRVQGRVRVAATSDSVGEVTVVVGMPYSEAHPLGRYRLSLCSSVKSRFEFWLPPGEYRLEAFAHNPPDLVLADFQAIKLTAEQREFDCGFLDLVPKPKDGIEAAKKSGTWVDLAERYGQPCPAWHAVAARGMPVGAQAVSFRDKWTLVYFWGPSCSPCLQTTLPKLDKFYETHRTQRNRFEIVSICCDTDGKMKTMDDLEKHLKPIVKAVWGGKELSFPLLLDNTTKTMENFGVEVFGTFVLVDPSGHLVQGDESTLAAILKEADRTKSR